MCNFTIGGIEKINLNNNKFIWEIKDTGFLLQSEYT